MFARTERLLLRPGWTEDDAALSAAIADEAIIRNLARAPWPYRIEDARDFLAREIRPDYLGLLVFARTESVPQLVGAAGYYRGHNHALEFVSWIARPHWGRGYATEAGHAVLRIARAMGHDRLIAGHFIDNPGSASVLRKLGFTPTGEIIRRFSAARAEEASCVLFEIALQDGRKHCPASCERDHAPAF